MDEENKTTSVIDRSKCNYSEIAVSSILRIGRQLFAIADFELLNLFYKT